MLGLFANRKLFAFVVLRKTGALFIGLSSYMTGTSRGNVCVGFTRTNARGPKHAGRQRAVNAMNPDHPFRSMRRPHLPRQLWTSRE